MARIIVAVVLISFLLPGFVVSQDYPHEVTSTLWSAFLAAREKGDSTRLQQCLDAGYPVDAIVMNWQTMLMLACAAQGLPFENRVDVVELLLNKGANPNIQVKTDFKYADQGQTALIMVVKNGAFGVDTSGKKGQQQLEIVELLLKAGADVNIRDEKGMTALQYALQSKNTKHLVNVLMKAQQSSKP